MLKLFMDRLKSDNRGYIMLMSVLIVGAVAVSVVVSLLLTSLNDSRTALAIQQSNQSKALANACAEEALEQIRLSSSFSGFGNISLGQGSCSYAVTNTGGNNRSITASSTIGTIFRRLSASSTALNPKIVVATWQEGQ